MPANLKIDRRCTCTPCKQTPQGYRWLKYKTWRQHQVQEKNLQDLLALQATLQFDAHAAALANLRDLGQGKPGPTIPGPSQLDEGANRNLNDIGIELDDEDVGDTFDEPFEFMHLDIPAPEPRALDDPGDPPGSPTPIFDGPLDRDHSESPPPPPPPLLPPLELEYDSDNSESNYEFSHAYNDPPNLRFAYLNALADHIVRKNSVRNAEENLSSTTVNRSSLISSSASLRRALMVISSWVTAASRCLGAIEIGGFVGLEAALGAPTTGPPLPDVEDPTGVRGGAITGGSDILYWLYQAVTTKNGYFGSLAATECEGGTDSMG
ncbi:unnamed protein product [Rhizoctonia solani]|uniref:Uncharacterized protein n=1 Tax=Rhizoctonia solani TaxID=456999 RepID=A0A8H3C1W3_9AGAM|nr:unnamed protein product [Rhizoctonia solani]